MNKKFDWNEFDRGVFLINVLAIVYNPKTKMMLIGKREKDPYIRELGWGFPGGRPAYDEELEDYLKLEVKKKTNLDVSVKNIIFSKTYPEDRRFLSIYYFVEAKNLGEEKPREKFTEIKWIRPSEIKKYFTTSIHPKLMKILNELK